MYILKHKTMRY